MQNSFYVDFLHVTSYTKRGKADLSMLLKILTSVQKGDNELHNTCMQYSHTGSLHSVNSCWKLTLLHNVRVMQTGSSQSWELPVWAHLLARLCTVGTGGAWMCACVPASQPASQSAIQHSVPSPSFPAWPADAQYRGKEQVSPLQNTVPDFNTHIKRWHRDRFSRCCEPDVWPCGTVVELLLMCHSDSIFRVNDRLITSVCVCVTLYLIGLWCKCYETPEPWVSLWRVCWKI